ncbi:hypothetical protein CVIRNUC_000308 [Coccomyxa viridis]|uniref:Uncharacterized protein n=1 Tax=Coccomyxa viridis TaxID=1274662 RepID=A0AAV1HQM9_9CHLO|nr:hypothetical protein CVIRNUC_000308 [Coccomyxa viridis]
MTTSETPEMAPGSKLSRMLTAMEGSDNATALTTDFKIIAQRMKLLGFNAIRLPFSFQVLWEGSFKPWNYGTTSVTQRDILQSVMPEE